MLKSNSCHSTTPPRAPRAGLIRAACIGAALLLAGCVSGPPKPLPPAAPPVPGSAPGPAYGQATPGTYAASPQMENLERQLRSSLDGSAATLRRTTDDRLWITLPGDMTFEPNRSALKPQAGQLLDRVAQALRAHASALIRIVGHTDNRGAASANDALSLDRAMSTRDWLVGRGVSPLRFAVAGRGSREPVESNDSDAGRAGNRRVDIVIGERALIR